MPFYNIDNKIVEEFLGKKKYQYTETSEKNEVGVVNGMAYTVFGGDILPIEATLYKGKGDLTLTGSLGDVMQESCHIALSYIKANMKEFSLEEVKEALKQQPGVVLYDDDFFAYSFASVTILFKSS